MPDASWWSRLRRTRIVQVLVVYLAGAWVAIQAVALFTSAFEWPKWVMRGSIVLLAAGLITTLLLVWANSRGAAAEGAVEPRRSRPLLAGATALGLVLVGLALFFVIRDRGRSLSPEVALASAAPGVAILPFSVNDPELERWREGLVDLLATNLDGAADLRTIDSRTLLARWRERVEGEGTPDLATSLDIARASGGRYAVLGSVISSGTNMRVVADVYDLERADQLGQDQVEGAPDSIFGLVDRLSIAILRRILTREGGAVPRLDLASVTTTSLPALKAFLEAEALARRSDFERAIPAFQEALAADSTFALAALRASQAYGWIEGLQSQRGVQALQQAARHEERLPTRDRDVLHATLALFGQREDASPRARQLVQTYPDDPYAWFLLGDIIFHLPYQTLASREERTRPFVQALRLDPMYTPAYIHLLDLAFQYADSARLAELLPRYDRLARGSAYDTRYRLAYSLAFGDPAARSTALAELGTVPTMLLGRTIGLLGHPRFTDVQRHMGDMIMSRPDVPAPMLQGYSIRGLLQLGHLRRAGELLSSPEIPSDVRVQTLPLLMESGVALPDGMIERAIEAAPDRGRGPIDFVLALQAIREGRWSDFERQIAVLGQAVGAVRARGDSAGARTIEAAVQALRGRAAMERGRPDEAREILETAYRSSGLPPAAAWLARLHAEAGREEEAIRYLETFPPDPWTALELAPLYEAAGRRDEAIEAYGWITAAWAGADPELQPRVVAARSAIARLEGLRRG